MRRSPLSGPRALRTSCLAGALALAVLAPAATAAAARTASVTPLFSAPSSIAGTGSYLVVADRSTNTLTVLRASSGALLTHVSATTLGITSPDAVVGATVRTRHVVFVSGASGPIAELALAAKGGSVKVTRVRTIKATGCTTGAATSLALDTKGHLFEACSNGVVSEWSMATAMLVRHFGQNVTGLTDATALTVLGADVFVTNAASAAAHSAPDGVVELSDATAKHVRTVTNATSPSYGFNDPAGITTDGKNLWVTNYNADMVDELSGTTLAFLQTSSTNLYNPGAVVATSSYVWISSVNGPASSMVTQFTVAQPTSSGWMMCNSNDVYRFDNPSGMTLNGTSLWVANPTDNLVDQMNATTGLLVKTFS